MPTNTNSIRATHMSLCATGFREKLERLASMTPLKPALPMFLASCKTAKLEVIRDMQLYCMRGSRRESSGLRCWPGMERCQGARGSALTATAEMSQLQQYSHTAEPRVWSWVSNAPVRAPIPCLDTSSSHHGLTKPFSFMNTLKQCQGKPPASCPPHALLNPDLGLVLPCSSSAPGDKAGRDERPKKSKGTSSSPCRWQFLPQ